VKNIIDEVFSSKNRNDSAHVRLGFCKRVRPNRALSVCRDGCIPETGTCSVIDSGNAMNAHAFSPRRSADLSKCFPRIKILMRVICLYSDRSRSLKFHAPGRLLLGRG
jgi:hypothetical protein